MHAETLSNVRADDGKPGTKNRPKPKVMSMLMTRNLEQMHPEA